MYLELAYTWDEIVNMADSVDSASHIDEKLAFFSRNEYITKSEYDACYGKRLTRWESSVRFEDAPYITVSNGIYDYELPTILLKEYEDDKIDDWFNNVSGENICM